MLLEPFILLCGRAHPSPRCLLTVLRGSGAREIGFAKKVNEALRRFHLGVATRYLSSTTTGTGSSTFRTLLKECIDGTDEAATRRDEV